MIHLQHYKDPEGVVTFHPTAKDAEEYMQRTGGCFTHAASCPHCKELAVSKVLVVYSHDVGEPAAVLALVDKQSLAGYPLEEMNNRDANSGNLSELAQDSICALGKRLGIFSDDMDGPRVQADLVDARILTFPITVDEVLVCSWHL